MTTTSAPRPSGRLDAVEPRSDRDYLVRSEEQLDVRTDRVVAAYARLEKFLVTETRTITVEVTHEEVRLVSIAAPADGAAAVQPSSADRADSGRWVVVNREEVVVSKRIVPVERVRLEVFPVTEQRQVTEELRKEHIDPTPHLD